MDKIIQQKSSNLLESLMNISSDSNPISSLYEAKINKKKVFVIKEKGNFLIVEQSDNPLGYQRVSKHNFASVNAAINNINLLIKEEEKYVIKKDAPVQEPIDSPEEEMGTEEEELSLEDDTVEDIETPLSEYQELTGKLAYILKDVDGELDDYEATVKYVMNSILASIKIDQVSDELLEEFTSQLSKESTEEEDQVEESYIAEMAAKKGYAIKNTFKSKTAILESLKVNEESEEEVWESYSMVDDEIEAKRRSKGVYPDSDVDLDAEEEDYNYDELLDEKFISINA